MDPTQAGIYTFCLGTDYLLHSLHVEQKAMSRNESFYRGSIQRHDYDNHLLDNSMRNSIPDTLRDV